MRVLVAIVLLLTVTPGMTEVAEAAVHLVLHGDFQHDGDGHEQGCDEHSCTVLAHHCGCHSAMSAQTSTKVAYSDQLRGITRSELRRATTAFGRVSEPPPLRPPIR
ncbi:MAG: hypothetical protein HOV81_20100 [Kofleriaceae bacterium]|nr:hypothetical protein [Kofleriaceae bacterium]